MTVHADINIHLTDTPTVRVRRSTANPDRVTLSIGDESLTIFAPTDVLRAILTDAADQLDEITGGAE